MHKGVLVLVEFGDGSGDALVSLYHDQQAVAARREVGQGRCGGVRESQPLHGRVPAHRGGRGARRQEVADGRAPLRHGHPEEGGGRGRAGVHPHRDLGHAGWRGRHQGRPGRPRLRRDEAEGVLRAEERRRCSQPDEDRCGAPVCLREAWRVDCRRSIRTLGAVRGAVSPGSLGGGLVGSAGRQARKTGRRARWSRESIGHTGRHPHVHAVDPDFPRGRHECHQGSRGQPGPGRWLR
mmetsp:Transcript_125582/g.351695  ORF Transcript_125582/g.351695 Transcript_125582/m.351695 type:complete len:237 (-) Transcript_125582:1404-2114(-)